MRHYKVVFLEDIIKEKYPRYQDFDSDNPCWALYEFEDDKPLRLVGSDEGEPEDRLLVRDWSWVPEELNKCLELLNYLIDNGWVDKLRCIAHRSGDAALYELANVIDYY